MAKKKKKQLVSEKKPTINEIFDNGIRETFRRKNENILMIINLKIEKNTARRLLVTEDKLYIAHYKGEYETKHVITKEILIEKIKSVSVDYFFVKTVMVLNLADENISLELLEKAKSFVEMLFSKKHIDVTVLERKPYNKIIGYRSKNKGKMIIASVVYFFILLSIMSGGEGDKNKEKPKTNPDIKCETRVMTNLVMADEAETCTEAKEILMKNEENQRKKVEERKEKEEAERLAKKEKVKKEAERLAQEEVAKKEAERIAKEEAVRKQAEESARLEAEARAREQVAQVPAPSPTPTNDVYYKNCTEARAAGVAPIYKGQPGYDKHLDRDGDGIGCDK